MLPVLFSLPMTKMSVSPKICRCELMIKDSLSRCYDLDFVTQVVPKLLQTLSISATCFFEAIKGIVALLKQAVLAGV